MADDQDVPNFRDAVSLSGQVLSNLKELENIEKRINKRLGENNKFYQDLAKTQKEITKELNKQAESLEKAKKLEISKKEVGKLVEDLKKQTTELTKQNGLIKEQLSQATKKREQEEKALLQARESLAEKQREIKLEEILIAQGKAADIDKLKSLEKELKQQEDIVVKKQTQLSLYEKESAVLEEIQDNNDKIIQQLEKEAELAAKIEKHYNGNKIALATTGGLLGGLSKIPFAKNFIDANKATEAMNENIAKGGSGIGTLFSGLAAGIKGLETASVVLTIFQAALSLFNFIKDAIFAADKANTRLAKNLSISKTEADELRKSFNATKNELDTIYNTVGDQIQAQEELSNLTKASILFSRDQIENQIILTREIGLSSDEAANLNETFSVFNENANEGRRLVYSQIAAFSNQNKVLFNGKKILSEVSKVSGQILASFRGNTKALVDAVLRTEKLGMTLEQARKISEGLLNFESSIEAELEAELLTGKQLNLERARGLALQGDYAGVAEEIASQVGDFYEFSKLNVLQQQSLAQSVGMQADELADVLRKREFITKESQNYLNNLREQAKAIRKAGDADKATALERKAAAIEQGLMTGQSVETAERSVDAQEKFNKALEKAKDIFANLFSGESADKIANLINKLVGALEDFVNSIQKRGIMGTLFGGGMEKERAVRLQEEAKKAQSEMQDLQTAYANAQTEEAKAEIKKQMDDVASRSQQIQKDIQTAGESSKTSFLEGAAKGGTATVKAAGLTAKAGKTLVGKGLMSAGTKMGGEAGAKMATKGAGLASKGLAKRIPILGSVVSAGFAVKDFMEGDYAGAGLQLASGAAGLLDLVAPGVGTALSIGIDAADAAREMGAFDSEQVEDALIRPGQKPVKFADGDIIVAAKKVQDYTGGGAPEGSMDMGKLISLMEEFIQAAKNPKEIVIQNNLAVDSQKFFVEASKHSVQMNS